MSVMADVFMFVCVVGLIPLNHRCQLTDRCQDAAASCYSGFCLCRATHYERNNICRTYTSTSSHLLTSSL